MIRLSRRVCAALFFFLGAGGVAASDLRPAPDYYLDAIFAVTAAQTLAVSCPSVSVNPTVATGFAEATLAQVDADGFDLTAEDLGMSGADAGLETRRTAFLGKHGLADGASADIVCAAAQAEIAEQSQIGRLLIALE